MVSLLQQAIREVRWSRQPRFLTEICLLKMTNRQDLKSIESLLEEAKKTPAVMSSGERGNDKQPVAPEPQKKKALTQSATPAGLAVTQADNAPQALPSRSKDAPSFTLNDIEAVWPDLLAKIKEKRMSIGMFLSEAEPVEVAGQKVTFGFPTEFKFHKETVEQQNNKVFVRDILSQVLGSTVEVDFVVTEEDREEKKIPVSPEKDPNAKIVMSAMEIFEGSKVIRKT